MRNGFEVFGGAHRPSPEQARADAWQSVADVLAQALRTPGLTEADITLMKELLGPAVQFAHRAPISLSPDATAARPLRASARR